MIREARAMVTMPVPILMSQDFWYSPSRQPDRAVMALATHRPTMMVRAGLMEEAFTMSSLSPVARMDRPSRVWRKTASRIPATATKAAATMSRAKGSSGVSASRSLTMVKTVGVVFRLRMDLPMIKMLMVYRPVLTMMPARMLSTPSRVWSRAVM